MGGRRPTEARTWDGNDVVLKDMNEIELDDDAVNNVR